MDSNIWEAPSLVRMPRAFDSRGSFSQLFSGNAFRKFGWSRAVEQVNFSFNDFSGTLRGMHAQRAPFLERKLVACIRGSVLDVVVDLRTNSPTFLKVVTFKLQESDSIVLLVPPGFAHGYQTLEDNVELVYAHDNRYSPDAEFGVNPFDPVLGIAWPLEVSVISDRDKSFPLLQRSFDGIEG